MAIEFTPRRIAALLVGTIALAAIAWWHGSSSDDAVPAAHDRSTAITAPRRIDPQTSPRGAIAGAIRDEAGAPIAGAIVCARGWSAALGTEALRDPACVATDRNGAYVVGNLLAAQYTVTATARTYRSVSYARDAQPWQSLAAGEHRNGIDITLRRGGVEISGTITDAGGGPVPHAHVQLEVGGLLAIDADEHGHYTAWVRPGLVDIHAVADGYAMAQAHAEAPGVVDLQLLAESTFAGTVVDAASATPIAGVAVTIDTAAGANQASPVSNSAITDEDGRFRIARLEPGRYTATARSAHGYGHSDGNIVLALGQHVGDAVVKLYPAQQVVGRIATPDDAVCVDPLLTLRDDTRNQTVYATAEPDGTLHADGVLPGSYTPIAVCANFLSRDYPPIVVGDRDATGLIWQVDRGSILDGRVVTSAGEPVEGAQISVSIVREHPRDVLMGSSATSSTNGAFALRGLKPGRYNVQAYPPHTFLHTSDESIELDLTAPHATHDFTIDAPAGGIVGRITARDGTPMRRVRLLASAVTNPRIYGDAASDDAGTFRCDNVPDGMYELSAYTAASVKLAIDGATRVTVAAGRVTTRDVVTDRPTGTIRGTVLDAHNAPVEDAFVAVVPEVGEEADLVGVRHISSDTPPILVSPSGAFAISDLEAGTSYTVRAFRRGAEEVIAAHVKAGTVVALKLAATGTIAGTITGAPIAGRLDLVLVERGTKEIVREDHVFRTNRFVFSDIPPGQYRLSATTAGAHEDVDIDVTDGARVPIAIDLRATVTLVGRVVDVRTHRPAVGIEVVVSKTVLPFTIAPKWDPYAGISGDDGRFELRDVPRGELAIDGWPRSDDDRYTSILGTKRTVPPTGETVIDVGELSAIPARGKRSDGAVGFGYAVIVEPSGRSLRVLSVDTGGPAERAGLHTGDEIIAIDGIDVTVVPDLIRLMLVGSPGARIVIGLATGATVDLELGTP